MTVMLWPRPSSSAAVVRAMLVCWCAVRAVCPLVVVRPEMLASWPVWTKKDSFMHVSSLAVGSAVACACLVILV